LGNLLFPLARAAIGREQLGGSLVVPTLRQFKIGPYFRCEKDKRTYGDILRPRTRQEWVEWANSIVQKSVNEDTDPGQANVVRYQGLKSQFHDLSGHAELVRKTLDSLSKCELTGDTYDIALHVRLGDFVTGSQYDPGQSTRLPLDWYKTAFEQACDMLESRTLKCTLFSDENAAKVISQLGISNLQPEQSHNALATMFSMSRARILIGSRSTFSLWAQYLGESKAIWPKGFALGQYKPIDVSRDHFL